MFMQYAVEVIFLQQTFQTVRYVVVFLY